MPSFVASICRCCISTPSGSSDAEVDAIENAERDQRREPLAVRRQLVNAITSEIDAERLDPVGFVLAEIVEADGAALGLGRRDDPFRQRAAIERLAAGGRDQLQGLGLFGGTKNPPPQAPGRPA